MSKVWRDTRGMDTLVRLLRESLARGVPFEEDRIATQIYLDALVEGRPIDVATRAIRTRLPDFDASLFVQDYSKRTGTVATLEAMFERGSAQPVSWLTSDDSLTCAECYGRETRHSSVSVRDALLMGAPPAHPGCRCMWLEKQEWEYVTGGKIRGLPTKRPIPKR
jgi:hypothetical protein